MKILILIYILTILQFHNLIQCQNRFDENAKSVLIIGTSFPALVSAFILSTHNFNVSLVYETSEIDNDYSSSKLTVNDMDIEISKFQPIIYESSDMTRKILEALDTKLFNIENTYSKILSSGKFFDVISDQSSTAIIVEAVEKNCVSQSDLYLAARLVLFMQKFNYQDIRSNYDNITLDQFGKERNYDSIFRKCILGMVLTGTGTSETEINAVDALSRAYFYYFSLKNSLRSYYPLNNDKERLFGFNELIVNYLKKQTNVHFKSKTKVTELIINEDGVVMSYRDNPIYKYDYFILGENAKKSFSILNKTAANYEANSKNYFTFSSIANKIELYKTNNKIASVKMFYNRNLIAARPRMLYIDEMKDSNNILSIKQLDTLNHVEYKGKLLELVVKNNNLSSQDIIPNLEKELKKYFPELKDATLQAHRIDYSYDEILKNTEFSTNRVDFDIFPQMGINNLYLSSNWVDLEDIPAVDTERLVLIGIESVLHLIRAHS